MKYSRLFINTILDTVNIVDLLENEYDYYLISNNNGWYTTHCPMPNHSDNSPSFGVNEDSNYYNCFGCGATGDVISLVMNIEDISFSGAVAKLAALCNLTDTADEYTLEKTIKDFNSSVNEYLNRETNSSLPGGVSENEFKFIFATRVKKLSENIDWQEQQYKVFDDLCLSHDHVKIANLWKNLKKNLQN